MATHASSLGSVIRDYEMDSYVDQRRPTSVARQQSREPKFQVMSYMLPDADGNLEVLASCRKHYAWLPKVDVFTGKPAPCGHVNCKGSKT